MFIALFSFLHPGRLKSYLHRSRRSVKEWIVKTCTLHHRPRLTPLTTLGSGVQQHLYPCPFRIYRIRPSLQSLAVEIRSAFLAIQFHQ
jgi:hypothetical protein